MELKFWQSEAHILQFYDVIYRYLFALLMTYGKDVPDNNFIVSHNEIPSECNKNTVFFYIYQFNLVITRSKLISIEDIRRR